MDMKFIFACKTPAQAKKLERIVEILEEMKFDRKALRYLTEEEMNAAIEKALTKSCSEVRKIWDEWLVDFGNGQKYIDMLLA